jgi:hypothetical protein
MRCSSLLRKTISDIELHSCCLDALPQCLAARFGYGPNHRVKGNNSRSWFGTTLEQFLPSVSRFRVEKKRRNALMFISMFYHGGRNERSVETAYMAVRFVCRRTTRTTLLAFGCHNLLEKLPSQREFSLLGCTMPSKPKIDVNAGRCALPTFHSHFLPFHTASFPHRRVTSSNHIHTQ